MINHVKITPLRSLAIVLLTIAMPLSFLVSCMREENDFIEYTFDPQTSSTIKETTFKTYIFDSGMAKCKATAKTLLIYDKAAEPYWFFPDGIHIEKLDSAFNVEASIKADTAYNYQRTKVWEAKGNVDITNLEGQRMQTSHIFWDQNKKSISSDSSFVMTRPDGKIIYGVGFTAKEDMTDTQIYKSSGETLW